MPTRCYCDTVHVRAEIDGPDNVILKTWNYICTPCKIMLHPKFKIGMKYSQEPSTAGSEKNLSFIFQALFFSILRSPHWVQKCSKLQTVNGLKRQQSLVLWHNKFSQQSCDVIHSQRFQQHYLPFSATTMLLQFTKKNNMRTFKLFIRRILTQ